MFLPWHLKEAPGKAMLQAAAGGGGWSSLTGGQDWRAHVFTITNQIVSHLPGKRRQGFYNAINILFFQDLRDPSFCYLQPQLLAPGLGHFLNIPGWCWVYSLDSLPTPPT